jgi:hypothetical protein
MADTLPQISSEDLRILVSLAKRALEAPAVVRKFLQAQGVTIVPANWLSDIPFLEDVERSFENKFEHGAFNVPSVFNPKVMADFLGDLDRYADEFDPPVEGTLESPAAFFWRNPVFSWSDAMAYYCVLRHFQPLSIVEIGAGFSTLVALEAVKRNGVGEIWCVDPFPAPWLEQLKGIRLVRNHVQNLDPSFFVQRLTREGDVLSIDSSHTVKAGGDCIQIYLRVLPAISANIVVHVHDIYLPFPIPARFAVNEHRYWTEQYVLYAYLLDNAKTQVIYGSSYHHALNRDRLDHFMRGRNPPGGASLWFKLLGKAASGR